MPSLEDFIESLTQEKTKLIKMGKIKGPRVHALTVHDGSQKYQKSKDKDKQKADALPKKEGYTKSFTDASRYKGKKGRKGEKCTYCLKYFNKKTLDITSPMLPGRRSQKIRIPRKEILSMP
jgi:hypothetical protein